jgi:WD40 repeat protein
MRAWTTQLSLGLILLFSGGIGSLARQENTTARPELVLQTGHTLKVNCVAFGPDGQWLASGGADNAIKIWEVSTGRELRALVGHSGWIKSIAVSSKGEWLASGSNDRSIKLWNVLTGQELRTMSGHTAPVEALAFSADDRWLISGSADRTIKIWDLATGSEKQTLTGHSGWVVTVALSSDGKFLASGSTDNTVKIWDVGTWHEKQTLQQQTSKITSLAFGPDSRWLAVGGVEGRISLWLVATGRERLLSTSESAGILAIRFSAGALISTAADGSIQVRDLQTWKLSRAIVGAPGSNELAIASFSPNGELFAVSTGNKGIELRSATTGKIVRMLESYSVGYYAVAFSRDGRWLASGTNDRDIRLWQVATGREQQRLVGHSGWVSAISFSEDSRFLASASISGEVKVWNISTAREAYKLPSSGGSINTVAFSPNGEMLASAGVQRTIQIWDNSSRQVRTLVGHTGEIANVVFSPDGNLLASASSDKTIRLWDPETGRLVRTFILGGDANSVCFSPDGRFLAAGGADKTVTIWEVAGASGPWSLAGHAGEVLAVAFSPDGRWLASSGSDNQIKVWDPKTKRAVWTFSGLSGNINSVTFSVDSRWIVSGSDDGSMMVWNTEIGSLAATLVSMRQSDDWLVVTPDGLFDGSPVSWNLLLWRFARNTFRVAPVDAFFNEFYYPGLLADILAGRNPQARQNISQKDRRQPKINLTLLGEPRDETAERLVKFNLAVAEAGPDEDHKDGSGVRDLRLFRNGLLVNVWTGNVLKGGDQRTIEVSVPVVAGENRFTAYAFNRDNIKTTTAALSVIGADSLKRVGTAYLLAIGVGQYANPLYNLNYSVADAIDIGEQLKKQQESLGRYKPVVTISLLNEDATKANIMLALKRLAGIEVGPLPPNAPVELAKIRPTQPEDAVLIYFSGHGTAQQDRYYLIPHDLGYGGSRTELDAAGLQTILAHSISDIELEETLKPLDADQLLLVIDACNSGQALEAEEKRRGPMNTRGLAQLAYEKGMYVLTASQSIEVAFESAVLKHSYLAYALVEEGIKEGAADTDRNGQILLDEWFAYATERVPRMGLQQRDGSKELKEIDPDENRVQRPRVFYTRELGAQRLVIAQLPVR